MPTLVTTLSVDQASQWRLPWRRPSSRRTTGRSADLTLSGVSATSKKKFSCFTSRRRKDTGKFVGLLFRHSEILSSVFRLYAYSVILSLCSSGEYVIMLLCPYYNMLFCQYYIMLFCQYVTLLCCPVIMLSLCHPVVLSLCNSVVMLSCHYVSWCSVIYLLLCHNAISSSLCHSVMLFCQYVILLFCLTVILK